MNQEDYDKIKASFESYVSKFISESEEILSNIDLKHKHSLRTAETIKDLAKEIELSNSDLLLVQAAALLHDIGRFEQLIKYGTFSDTDQINHIDLGISAIQENHILANLNEEEKEIIIECIRFHHLPEIPKSINEKALPFVQLVRDSDRIDAMFVAADYYSCNKSGTNRRLEMELADKPEISKKLYQQIMKEKVVSNKEILTLNDLKLQQMSWVFDLNFKKSFQIVSEKTLLKQIYETLPKKDLVIDMYRQMKIYLENQL